MISIKNATLLVAVLVMGFVLISSVSAIDANESLYSDDVSGSNISSDVDLVDNSGLDDFDNTLSSISYSNKSGFNEINNADASNVSKEILSTNSNVGDLYLDNKSISYNSKDNPKNMLSSGPLLATTKTKVNITNGSTTIYKGDYFSITLTDSAGKALVNKSVIFSIIGKNYTKVTDGKGVASLKINLNPGNYSCIVSYAGSSVYTSSKLSTTLCVAKSFSVSEINVAANNLKRYVLANKRLPNTVTVAGTQLKVSEFAYLMAKGVYNLNSNNKANLKFLVSISPCNYSSIKMSESVYRAQYVDLAKRILDQVDSGKVIPSSAVVYNAKGVSVGKAGFDLYTFAFAKILAFYNDKGYLPNYCSFVSSDLKVTNPVLVATSIKSKGDNVTQGSNFLITLTDSAGKALANQKVTFTISKNSYTKTTDSKGVASLKINLSPGKYSCIVSYAGSSVYTSSKLSTTLCVAKSFSVSEINVAANNLKRYVLANKRLPNTVTVAGTQLKVSEFAYLMAKGVYNLNSNNKANLKFLVSISPCNYSSIKMSESVYRAQYVDLAKRILDQVDSGKVIPSSAVVYNAKGVSVGKAGFDLYTFAFAKILAFYNDKGYLPNYCSFVSSDLKVTNPVLVATSIKSKGDNVTQGSNFLITLTDSAGKALANQKVTFTISKNSYTKTTDSKGVASLKINLSPGKYSCIVSYAGSSVYKSSKISITLISIADSNKFSLSEIKKVAVVVKKYVVSNKVLPNTVKVANSTLSISEFSYLMSKAVYNINAGNLNSIALLKGISKGGSSGDYLNVTIYKAKYVDLSKRVMSFVESNMVPPVYAKVCSSSGEDLGNAEFDLYTFAFAKILAFYNDNGYLPNYCTFESSAFKNKLPSVITNVTPSSTFKANSSQFKVGLNEKNDVSDLSIYLVGSGYSAITSSIRDLANKLTKGLSSVETKALAIYNYVRDEIDYSYYANSKYGADGTLAKGSGNCVDQANLVIALCRASGIYARYSHAQGCTFSSGLVTGHVWAQIYINGVWYAADATSSRNTLGNIKNWNTNSFYALKQYATISF